MQFHLNEGLTNEAGIFLPVYPGHQAASQAASDESTLWLLLIVLQPLFISDQKPQSLLVQQRTTDAEFISQEGETAVNMEASSPKMVVPTRILALNQPAFYPLLSWNQMGKTSKMEFADNRIKIPMKN